ncbi:PspC domain-containing protein [Microbacterium karelineae]|uniref:PspC domain-containing protein n=1 Tax=Microbacterium karelineae TaxID=2654283 RepID=UPI0012EA5C78|nr:PspC domain-containing protein [Microbacterium karelineae]
MTTPLVRPRADRMVAGVCAAVARRFDLSPKVVRALTIVGLLFFGWTLPAYIALWIVIPTE